MKQLTTILTLLLERFEQKPDKADLLLKRSLSRYRLGKNERQLLYDAFYLIMRSRAFVEFFSPDLQSCHIASTALSLIGQEEQEERLTAYQQLSAAEQALLINSYPSYWQEQLEQVFTAEQLPQVKSYLNSRAGITLLNLERRQSSSTLINFLQDNKIKAEYGRLSPYSIRVEDRLIKTEQFFFFF